MNRRPIHDQIQRKNRKRYLPHVLTWVEDSRPGNLTLGMIFCIESDLQVEDTQFLHLDLEIQQNGPTV